MNWKNKRFLWLLLLLSVLIHTGCGKTDRDDLGIAKIEYQSYEAETPTETVGGLLAYNKNSDMILDIPEDYFLNLDNDMTWDELIAEIGEPRGTIGFGIVRDYWRIGEDKYAVADLNIVKFRICGK